MATPAFLYHPHVAETLPMGKWSLTPDSLQPARLFKATLQLLHRLGFRGLFDMFPAQIYDNNAAFYPKRMHEFLPQMIPYLSPVKHITFDNTAYWPTAWILHDSKWVPLEYMREDLIGQLVPPERKALILDNVKTHLESFPTSHNEKIIFRQGVATFVGERSGYGAFPDLRLFLATLSPEYYDASPNATQLRGSLSLFEVREAVKERESFQKQREDILRGGGGSNNRER